MGSACYVFLYNYCNLILYFKVYTTNLSRLYDREVKDFMEAAKNKIAPKMERKGNTEIN